MRYRPVGWRFESFRHSLAARKISTKPSVPSLRSAIPIEYGRSDRNLPEPFRKPEFGKSLPGILGSVGLSQGYPIENGILDDGRIIYHGQLVDPNNKESIIAFLKEYGGLTAEQAADPAFLEARYQKIMADYEKEAQKNLDKIRGKYGPGNFIPRVSTLDGAPMLVNFEQFYLLSRDQQELFLNRMVNRLSLDDGMMRHLHFSKDAVAEFKGLPIDAQKEYLDKMFALDMKDRSQGVDEDSIPRQVKLLEDSGKVLTEEIETTRFGPRPEFAEGEELGGDISFQKAIYPLGGYRRAINYQGDVDFIEQKDRAQQEYDRMLSSGSNVKDFSNKLPELAKFLAPMSLDARQAADKKRYYQLAVAETIDYMDQAKKQGEMSDDEYNQYLGIVEDQWDKLTKFANSVINANRKAQTKWIQDKKLELAFAGGGSAAEKSLFAKIGSLGKLSDAEFFSRSQEIKNAVNTGDIGKTLSPERRDNLMKQINYQETLRKVQIARARSQEKPVRVVRERGPGEIGTSKLLREVEARIKALKRLKPGTFK